MVKYCTFTELIFQITGVNSRWFWSFFLVSGVYFLSFKAEHVLVSCYTQ